MESKTRVAIILGSMLAAVAFCAGVERFYFSPAVVPAPAPQSNTVAANEAPAPTTSANFQEPTRPAEEPTNPVTAKPAPSHEAIVAPSKIALPVAQETPILPTERRRPAAMPKAIMEPRSAQPQEPREAVVASNDEPKRIPAEAAQAPAVQEPAPVAPMPAPPIAVIAARPAPAPEPVKVAELPATPKEIVAPQPATASITETPAPQEKPLVHEAPKKEPAKKPEAPKAAEPVANEGEEPELWIKPSVGYGVRWYQIEQSGAFGGIKGSALAMNVLSFDTMVRYGAWNLDVGLEKFSSEFAGDTTDPTIKSDQPFKHFYLKPGYGIFFLGIDAQTSPIVRASGTTLQWTGLTTLSALAGIRKEWLFDNRRRKPFHLGFEVDGSYPLSVSGDGGAPSASSPSGYGASLRGYVEKSIIRRDEYRLNFGLDGTASYDKLNFNGDWAGSSGGTTRSILELGSKVYLGIEF